MKETQAIIERVRRVNETHQQLELAVDASLSRLMPGQSVLARIGDHWNPYLREQWWPVGIGNNRLIVERSSDTQYKPGEVVSLLGIVGQPYKFRRTLRNVLLIAYDTEPVPLLMPIPSLLANRVSVTLLLLGRAGQYTTGHLPPEVEVIQGDTEMNWPNRVTTVGWADQVFVTVPSHNETETFTRVLNLFRELRAEIPQAYLFGVFKPIMPCGVGACSACAVRLKGASLMLTCLDGPARDLTEIYLP